MPRIFDANCAKSELACIMLTLFVCVPELSMAQPDPAPGGETGSGSAVGDIAAYAWIFAASVLILASALAVLIVAVAREVHRAPASALVSRQWHISLVAGSVALFGILIAESFLFLALPATTATPPAAMAPPMPSAETVAAPTTVGEVVRATDVAANPVEAETIVPGDRQEIALGLDDHSRFELTVPSSGEYVIGVEGTSDGFDAYLSVLGENGELLGVDDDGGDRLDSRLTIALEADRTYYVVVQERLGAAGTCSLSVQAPSGERPGDGAE